MIEDTETQLNRKKIGDIFKSFGVVENINDGRKVEFPRATAGKIYYSNIGKIGDIIKQLDNLFKSSIYAFSTNENSTRGKERKNVSSYPHYVNKLQMDGKDYYIRFTIMELNKSDIGNVHGATISRVDIADNIESGELSNHAETVANPSPLDLRLQNYLNDVKSETEKNAKNSKKDLCCFF